MGHTLSHYVLTELHRVINVTNDLYLFDNNVSNIVLLYFVLVNGQSKRGSQFLSSVVLLYFALVNGQSTRPIGLIDAIDISMNIKGIKGVSKRF